MTSISLQAAYKKDVADVKFRAAEWRRGKRIDKEIYQLVCQALDSGSHSPQAVMMAVADLAFAKRNAMKPDDKADVFQSVLRNQEQRIRWWVNRNRSEDTDP